MTDEEGPYLLELVSERGGAAAGAGSPGVSWPARRDLAGDPRADRARSARGNRPHVPQLGTAFGVPQVRRM